MKQPYETAEVTVIVFEEAEISVVDISMPIVH